MSLSEEMKNLDREMLFLKLQACRSMMTMVTVCIFFLICIVGASVNMNSLKLFGAFAATLSGVIGSVVMSVCHFRHRRNT